MRRKKRVITVNLTGQDGPKASGRSAQPEKKPSKADLDLEALEQLAKQRGTSLAKELAKVVQGFMDGKK